MEKAYLTNAVFTQSDVDRVKIVSENRKRRYLAFYTLTDFTPIFLRLHDGATDPVILLYSPTVARVSWEPRVGLVNDIYLGGSGYAGAKVLVVHEINVPL